MWFLGQFAFVVHGNVQDGSHNLGPWCDRTASACIRSNKQGKDNGPQVF